MKGLQLALKRLIEAFWPELSSRTHLPHKARVTALRSSAGRAGPPGECRYSVDVEPLTPDLKPDPSRPPLRDVPLDLPWVGPSRGVYALPKVGAIVRIAYYEGNPAYPYVDGILSEGEEVVEVEVGEFMVRQGDTWLKIRPDGEIWAKSKGGAELRLKADGSVALLGASVIEIDAPQIVLAGGGPPIARVGDQVQVGSAIGQIISGSPKVVSG